MPYARRNNHPKTANPIRVCAHVVGGSGSSGTRVLCLNSHVSCKFHTHTKKHIHRHTGSCVRVTTALSVVKVRVQSSGAPETLLTHNQTRGRKKHLLRIFKQPINRNKVRQNSLLLNLNDSQYNYRYFSVGLIV